MGLLEEIKKMIPIEIIDGSNVEEIATIVDLDLAYKLLLVKERFFYFISFMKWYVA